MRQQRWFRGFLGAVAMALVASSCLIGPITGPGQSSLGTGIDLADVDYEFSEFFLGGAANSYGSDVPLSADGRWAVTPDDDKALFLTRLVAFTPSDPADFSGTVIVEWMNVTSGGDIPVDWTMAHNNFIRSGHAFVGVTAQVVGVNRMLSADPVRYERLNHPGDSYSYDIFSQAGIEVRDNPDLLGGLEAEYLIAAGESQSASRMVSYINGVHPVADVYDGFMVHSRGSGGSSLRQEPLEQISAPRPGLIRDDLDEPVFVVQSEDDVIRSNTDIRQPDTDRFRMWELAGSSHADAYVLRASANDPADGSGTQLMFELMQDPVVLGCAKPVNSGPHWLLLQAAYDSLDTWIRTGATPPIGDPFETDSTSPTVLARDEVGNALGGVRSPHVDVPIARIDGLNTGPSFCRLFGSTTPLTDDQLDELYPSPADFVTAWTDATNAAIAGGFILPVDGPALIAAAESSGIGGPTLGD